MASSLQLRRVSRPTGSRASGSGTMLTALRLSGLKPPKIELDERTERAFPDFADRVHKFNDALVEWWKKAAVLIDGGESVESAAEIASLKEQVATLAESVGAASGSASSATTTPKLSVAAWNQVGSVIASSSSAFSTSDDDLVEWTQAERYRIISATPNESGHMKSATIRWPDGSLGTFTTLAHNSTHLAIDSYQITHSATGRRVVQGKVTRDANGFVTAQPNLIVL